MRRILLAASAALACALAVPTGAAETTAADRALVRDGARAAEVIGQRLARARASAAQLQAARGTDRRVDDALRKASDALAAGSYASALQFVKRAEGLVAQAAVQQ